MNIEQGKLNKDVPLEEINFFDPQLLQDPHQYYERLRNEAPVFRDPKNNIVYVSTYDLIKHVNSKPTVFSNKFGEQLRAGSSETQMHPEEIEVLMTGIAPKDTMLTADPPEQTRYRKLAMKAFTYKRVLQMGDYVKQVTNELIDAFIDDGHCEFKAQFGNLLPLTVIADALGVPREDMPKFRTWSDAFIVQLGGVSDKETRVDAAHKIIEFQKYMVERIEEKRTNPTEDIISDLVHADLSEEGDERKMDHSELISILQQLLVAGNETTSHSLTAGLYFLIQNPKQLAEVVANHDLIPNFVEETLRYLTPTNNMWRVATEDTQIGDMPVKTNDLILLRYGSGNRDEGTFADGNAFDIHRKNAEEHLAFGAGIHTCIGAQLARKEMNTAFPIIFDRLKNIRFQDGKNTFEYDPNILLRGVLQLHLEFDK